MTSNGPRAVDVPADIDITDTLLFGLSATQAAVIAPTALGVIAAWHTGIGHVPVWVLGAGTAVIGIVVCALVLVRRDGVGVGALAAAALTHPRRPLAPGDPEPDDGEIAGLPVAGDMRECARLPMAAHTTPGGIVTTGAGRCAVVEAMPVAFATAHPHRQQAIIASLAHALHALTGPVQVLITTSPVRLGDAATRIRERAPDLAHPALEAAALAHADYLDALSASSQTTRRRVLLVAPLPPGEDPEAAADRRARELTDALAAAGVTARPVEGGEWEQVMRDVLNPPLHHTHTGKGLS